MDHRVDRIVTVEFGARLSPLGEQPLAVAGNGDQLASPVTGVRGAADEPGYSV
jgi:hypothetical protein